MFSRAGFGGLLLVALNAPAWAQVPFQLVETQQGQSAVGIQNGASLTMAAPLGGTQTIQLVATYSGSGVAVIPQQPNVIGSAAFTATISGTLPRTLSTGGSVTLTIVFSPTAASLSTGQINLIYVETLAATGSNAGTIAVSLQGTAPTLSLSYVLQTNQNVVPLQSGGQIPFPVTLVGSTSQAALDVTNAGSGAGAVTSVTITGAGFSLQGTPSFPDTVPPNTPLQTVVQILFTPTAVGPNSGQITVAFSSGSPVTVNLGGNGIAPSFTYQILGSGQPTSVSPGGTIPFAATNVGQTSSLTIHVVNGGNTNGTIGLISVVGQGFQLGTVVVPQTLAPSASLNITINFTPAQAGAVTGTLIVNSDLFTLSGTGLGPVLVFSYLVNGSSVALSTNNPSVIFSPIAVTKSEQVTFDVKNTGTTAATISNIGVAQVPGAYTLSGLPALPVIVPPNADFQITITFTPTAVGPATGSLTLDTTSISLVGSGTQPPALPAYTITGPSGNTTPMTQAAVGLSLASAYPVAISGTLTISSSGTLPVDPAVQFQTGGTTVSFVIPANKTDAVFGAQGTQIGLQIGTVASTVTLTPSFATQTGNVSLTPVTPPVLQFTVAPAAPALVAVQLTGLTATGFTIQVTGYATTRALTSATVQFTPTKGFSLSSSQIPIDVSQVARLWFQTTASNAFGGQFTLSLPFTFQGLASNQTVANSIAAVSVAVSNSLGASNSIQASVVP